MFTAASLLVSPLSLLLHSSPFPHTFYQCKSDQVTSLLKTCNVFSFFQNKSQTREALQALASALFFSSISCSSFSCWNVDNKGNTPFFQFLKPQKLFSTLRPHLNTCLCALHTATLFLAFRSHLNCPLLRWVFLGYHKVHLAPARHYTIKTPSFLCSTLYDLKVFSSFFLKRFFFCFFFNMDHFKSLYWIC